ncbi:prolipoprotein diacylglyceryl transferase [Sulfurimonas autotrophica]|uniref:Phosphatidylglycerol--prolipoprotein diacylglyceryl transferase n=1 Tax=Sulfurimonas autotrophica (strain ATCC BAA-671 / DSM 16294 / JCM 11897 / OK10) TaxID=563040 RepID=E0UV13_SULAO|nr:prolipoprotein diacylglyceryl transferase [Sulfurimonas autotrophica]ADN09595.1 prolipoprotein diacylglyceryl transferase [Sulfurimonas autotrophica DSM 16294]
MHHFVWNIDPVLISFGPLQVHWYGLLFAAAILSGLEFMKWVYRLENKDESTIEPLFLYAIIGIVVGARLGHCLFYDPDYYLAHPMRIFAVWEGGLASHGGGLGVLLALYLGCKKYKIDFLWLVDRLVVPTALFGFFVRMGNFMNSEIIGKPSDLPWAVVFSRVDSLPRHPAQLYEAFSYLAIFFLLTYIYIKNYKQLQKGFLFGFFLVLVFSARFLIEFVKVKQADYSLGIGLSTGQLLSIPFLLVGIVFMIYSYKKSKNSLSV